MELTFLFTFFHFSYLLFPYYHEYDAAVFSLLVLFYVYRDDLVGMFYTTRNVVGHEHQITSLQK